jgi:hypothetical protein
MPRCQMSNTWRLADYGTQNLTIIDWSISSSARTTIPFQRKKKLLPHQFTYLSYVCDQWLDKRSMFRSRGVTYLIDSVFWETCQRPTQTALLGLAEETLHSVASVAPNVSMTCRLELSSTFSTLLELEIVQVSSKYRSGQETRWSATWIVD